MEGSTVIHLYCACGRVATTPSKREWDALLRDQLLPKFRCSVCGARPVDMRRGWMALEPPVVSR